MSDSTNFVARSVHVIASDRIYRVDLRNGSLYFLRIGGQFNVDRGLGQPPMPGKAAAVMILSAGEGLFRKHKEVELLARDSSQDPEDLLRIHPHNFKLLPGDIRKASFLPKKWFLSLFRPHYGRLILELQDGNRREFHFENAEDIQTALTCLPGLLVDRIDCKIAWDQESQKVVKVDR